MSLHFTLATIFVEVKKNAVLILHGNFILFIFTFFVFDSKPKNNLMQDNRNKCNIERVKSCFIILITSFFRIMFAIK